MRLLMAFGVMATLAAGSATDSLKPGKAELRSAGPLAFGPDGVLFIGDSAGAAVFALDTNDRTVNTQEGTLDVKGIQEKIAAVLGAAPEQIYIYDTAVNPLSKAVYISVMRGRGPDGVPVILRIDPTGRMSELSLDGVKFASVSLPDSRRSSRMETITYLQYVRGNVIVAGLSNEDFSSKLHSIPFPFRSAQAGRGASIEIFHTSHGYFETNAPVRTFVPVEIGKKPYILAAYTCTPLVKIPVSELKPGNKVTGETITELGAHNRPLDMIAYRKEGHDYLLVANSSYGVMKLSADHLETYEPLTEATRAIGMPHQRLKDWSRVHQLKKVDDHTALILSDAGGSIDLRMVPLP